MIVPKAVGATNPKPKGGKAEAEDNFTVKLTDDGSVRITKYKGKTADLVIPATIQGLPVTEIGSGDWPDDRLCNNAGFSFLTSVVIPEGVKALKKGVFVAQSKLKAVSLPNTLTAIEGGVFANCTSLTSVVIPDSVTTFPHASTTGVFQGCTKLTSVTLPKGMTEIPEGMFKESGLTSFEVPEGITSICDGAFNGCEKLTSVTLPSTIQRIGFKRPSAYGLESTWDFGGTFADCKALTTVNIPGSVTRIDWKMVNEYDLTAATPKGDNFTFRGCKSLALAVQARLKQLGWSGQL
jgi:hypothetical protein